MCVPSTCGAGLGRRRLKPRGPGDSQALSAEALLLAKLGLSEWPAVKRWNLCMLPRMYKTWGEAGSPRGTPRKT